MATNKHEVELILKANNLSNKTLGEVRAAVDKLKTSLNEQIEAARKGDVTMGELSASYRKLEEAGKAIVGQQALVDRFRQVSAAVQTAADKVTKAKLAFSSLASEQANYSEVTKQQDKDLLKLSKAVESSEKALARQQNTLSSLARDAKKAGIDLDNLASTQEAIVRSAEDVATAQLKASEAVDGYATSIRQLRNAQKTLAEDERARAAELERTQTILRRAAAEEAAAARQFQAIHEQNAKFIRDAEYVRFWTEALDKAEKEELDFANSVRAASRALEEQEKAAKRAGEEAARAAAKKKAAEDRARENALSENPFASEGRTTLSLLQRIRGELLAITAAYVGLQGAVGGVVSVLNTYRTAQQVPTKLLAANGNDARAAAEEYAYLRKEAQRLGLFFPELAEQYSKFAIAARAANLDTKEMRFVFERVAEAGKVLDLDSDNIEGIFNAITQMVSKGKVSTEELRGQLGDRLPGALQFAAKQYKGGIKEFVAQLEKGNIEATNGVLNLARGLDGAFKEQIKDATASVSSQENRFRNALFDFQELIAKSGLAEAYEKLVVRLTDFLRSDEGAEFAKKLAAAFSILADALLYVVDNLETFQTIATAILGIYLAKQFFNMALGAAEFGRQLLQMNANLNALPAGVAALQKSLLVLQAGMVGFSFGTWLYDSVQEVRQYGAILIGVVNGIAVALKFANKIVGEGLYTLFTKNADAAKAKVKELKDQMVAELKTVSQITKDMFNDATDESRKALAAQEKLRAEAEAKRGASTGTKDPGGRPAGYETGDEEAKRVAALQKSLLAEVEAVESQSLKKQKDNIQSIISGIDLQYQALIRKINESGIKGAEELKARLQGAVNVLKTEAIEKYNDAQLQKIESIQKTFAEIQTRLGKSDAGTMGDRLSAIDASYKSLYADIAELDAERQGSLKVTLDLLVQQLKVVEQQKFAQDKITDSQKQMNDAISARDDRIKTTNDLIQSGLLTEQEGRQRIKDIIAESQPGIEAYAKATREVVESLREVLDPAAYEAAIAKIDLAVASASKFKTELYSAADANNDLASGLTGALSEAAQGFGKAIVGAQSFGDAIKGTGKAFLQFAGNFLLKIGEMILQQVILNALQGTGFGKGIGGFVNRLAGATVAHDGAVVGQGNSRTRSAPASWFDNAPRYHNGGAPNLASDEYAAILQKNEEVLSADNPRNILNGGGMSAQPVVAPQDIKIINAFNAKEVVNEGLSSNVKTLLNIVNSNSSAFNQALGR